MLLGAHIYPGPFLSTELTRQRVTSSLNSLAAQNGTVESKMPVGSSPCLVPVLLLGAEIVQVRVS